MLKRILILMGESPSSEAAREYAFRLARSAGADLAGLAGIDLAFIESREPVPLGGMAFKANGEHQLREEADKARVRLHEKFRDECSARDVTFEWLSFEGDPTATLRLAAETRDLLVTGHDTTFHGKTRETLSAMLSQLLLMSPRPVILCPNKLPAGNGVLIGYDGSLPSMRALQMFALLGIGKASGVQVTSIDPDEEIAARHCNAAASYLRSHGYDVAVNPIASRTHPADVLKIEVVDRDIGTLVTGSYGHRGLKEALFGSTTTQLVDDLRCAHFLYH